jgi:hypothetical protein
MLPWRRTGGSLLTTLVLACARDPRLPLDRPLPCAAACERAERARIAVDRAIGWLDDAQDDPAVPMNIDAVTAVTEVARTFRSARLDALAVALRTELDRPGEPRRRLYTPDARLAENPSTWWTATGPEVGPNQVLVEVLYCPEWGLRAETVTWLCGPLRDDGGRGSTHAAWFLSLAVDAGCLTRSATCLDALADELRAGAAVERPLESPVERDLLGEQILFGLVAGVDPASLASAVDRLIAVQQPDGAFGPPDKITAHATLVAAWGLTGWIRAQQPSASATSPNAPGEPRPTPPAPPLPSE